MNPSKRVCRYGSTDQPMLMSVATGRVRLPTAAALYQSSICGVNSAYQNTPASDPGVCRHPDFRSLGHGQAEVPLQGGSVPNLDGSQLAARSRSDRFTIKLSATRP